MEGSLENWSRLEPSVALEVCPLTNGEGVAVGGEGSMEPYERGEDSVVAISQSRQSAAIV